MFYIPDAPNVTNKQQSYTVTLGNTTTLLCTVSAFPPATVVTWTRLSNGVSTDINVNSDKYTGGNITTPSLTIKHVDGSDQGYYMCSATNDIGKSKSDLIYLSVTGSEYCDLHICQELFQFCGY